MYANEQFVGDDLVDAEDVAKVTRVVDVWTVVARPCRQRGGGTIHWRATTGGRNYGPFLRIDDLFSAVEKDVNGERERAIRQHRFGDKAH